MELSVPLALALGVGRLASASLVGRLPGIAAFGAGLISGALAVALAGRLAGRNQYVHAGAARDLATATGELAGPQSSRLLPGEAARAAGQDAPQRGQAGPLAGKADGGRQAGRHQDQHCHARPGPLCQRRAS